MPALLIALLAARGAWAAPLAFPELAAAPLVPLACAAAHATPLAVATIPAAPAALSARAALVGLVASAVDAAPPAPVAATAAVSVPQTSAAAPADILPADVRDAAAAIPWTPELVDRLIAGLPKVETHLHLDGALSPATIKALAERQRYAPLSGKSVDEIAAVSVVSKPRDSLAEVLKAFSTIYPLLHTPDAVETMAYETVAAAARDHALYVEVRFAPALQAADGFNAEQALRAALKGLKRAEADFGVKSGVIVCLIRPFAFVSREKNAEMTDLAVRYKNRGVVGLDLAGNEAAQPLSDFREFFARAQAAGLRLTTHAGEVPGSGDLETALALGVDRLGHATLLAAKPALLEEVRRRRIPIEVNLTSNLRTNAVVDLSAHPAKAWYAAGIPITLSTDDPGVFGIDLNHEYRLLARELGFAPVDVIAVAAQGIDALFLPEPRKRELRARFDADVRSLLRGLAAP